MDEALLKYRSYEAMAQVANGNATKIIVPSELQNFATAGMVFSEVMDKKPLPPKPEALKHRVPELIDEPLVK